MSIKRQNYLLNKIVTSNTLHSTKLYLAQPKLSSFSNEHKSLRSSNELIIFISFKTEIIFCIVLYCIVKQHKKTLNFISVTSKANVVGSNQNKIFGFHVLHCINVKHEQDFYLWKHTCLWSLLLALKYICDECFKMERQTTQEE